ncbi:MAG: 4'-phosphopantetheinyl transferase superfamily protein [Bacteroidales bacterium]|nr:4'-phosphopantetheinyl transferase superfamily protein [Bacteroidales bacterium]
MSARCVWAVREIEESADTTLPTILATLPDTWQRYVVEVKLPMARLQRAMVAELLRHVLAQHQLCADVQGIGHLDNGLPFLPDYPNLSVSISHCRRAVAVAVAGGTRVGIDVESPRKLSPVLINRVLSEDERRSLAGSDHFNKDFLLLWTRKEAALKCCGTGIKGFDSLVNIEQTFAGRWEQLTLLPTDVVGHLAVDQQWAECHNAMCGQNN